MRTCRRRHPSLFHRDEGRCRAFTSVELMMVLLIMAICASLGIDAVASFDSHQRAERAARNCLAFMRYARNLAMTTGKSAELKIDTTNGIYSVYWQSNGSTWDTNPVSESLISNGSMSIKMSARKDLYGTSVAVTPAGTTAFVYTPLGACATAGTLTFTCAGVTSKLTIPAVGDPVVN